MFTKAIDISITQKAEEVVWLIPCKAALRASVNCNI